MTEDYHRDMTALKIMIEAVKQCSPEPGSEEAIRLAELNQLLEHIRKCAKSVDSNALATKARARALKENFEVYGRSSLALEQKLNGLQAAGADLGISPMDWLFLLLEQKTSAPADYVDRLREALGANHPGRSDAQSDLGDVAQATGAAADALFAKVVEEESPGNMLLASILHALMPVAESVGLPPEVCRTLRALRDNVEFTGGGGPGSGYWPSNYVYSSSSSGGDSSSSSSSSG